MSARTGKTARDWALAQITAAGPAPTKDGTWFRWCLVFVRMCFGIDAMWPTAGAAWDNAQRRHRVTRGADVPAFAPVYWELPSVADHIAFSIGNGLCVSTDAKRKGKPDIVSIDDLSRAWGATLLGWSEDLNGQTVWTPPETRKPRKPTRVKQARSKVWDAIALLDEAVEKAGRGSDVEKFRDALRDTLREGPKS